MLCSRNVVEQLLDIELDSGKVDEIKKFYYLGSKITKDGRSKADIKSRIALAKKAFLNKRT